jgi:hypothetical protein
MLQIDCCIKFCQKLGVSLVEIIWKILVALSDDAMGIMQIKERCNWFKDCCTSVDWEPVSSRPST